MTKKQSTAEPEKKSGKAPTHILFMIEEAKSADSKSNWIEVAVGWENADGSVNLRSRAGALLLPGHTYQLRTNINASGE